MTKTKIEWTAGDDGTAGETWNPTTGCDRVSPGCDNCYALTLARRLKGMGAEKYQRDGDPKTSGPGFGITMHPDTLDAPLRWRKPRRVFVNSMSDLFHDGVSADFIAKVWAVMAATPQHTYQILTKRHGRMRSLLQNDGQDLLERLHIESEAEALYGALWPLPNVWLGVSVEDQKRADLRIPALLDTPAAVRFLSCEPLLGPVDLDGQVDQYGGRPRLTYWLHGRPGWGEAQTHEPYKAITHPLVIGPRIDWVIVGGESGWGARPMELDWARTIVQQCQNAGVPVFVKQLGKSFAGSGKGNDMAAWPADLRVREFPQALTRAAS